MSKVNQPNESPVKDKVIEGILLWMRLFSGFFL